MFKKHINKKLMMYIDGRLSIDERRPIEDHLKDCKRCQSEHDEISFGKSMMESLQTANAPDYLWAVIEKELVSGSNREHRLNSRFTPKLSFAAIVIVILITAGVYWLYSNRVAPPPTYSLSSWKISKITGDPKVNGRLSDNIGIGQTLITDDKTSAQISVGDIGSVKVEPNTRIQLLKDEENEHRLALNKGKITAFIWAPPGKFYVNTPSAVAVDLGCSYTLEVDDDGVSILKVTMGWVAFERDGRESFIPADAECITRPGTGIGTPYFNDASSALKEAIKRFDTITNNSQARSAELNNILATARKADGLTLWHLLERTDGEDKAKVFDRFYALISLPKSITKEGILRNDKNMIDQLWNSLELGDTDWWRMWKKKG